MYQQRDSSKKNSLIVSGKAKLKIEMKESLLTKA